MCLHCIDHFLLQDTLQRLGQERVIVMWVIAIKGDDKKKAFTRYCKLEMCVHTLNIFPMKRLRKIGLFSSLFYVVFELYLG